MISIPKALLIFHLWLISSQATGLLGTQFKDFIKENRYFQHIFGYVLMLTIIGEFDKIHDPFKLMWYTSLAYVIFILFTKLELQWNLAILIMLTIGYLYDIYIKGKMKRLKEDPVIESEDLGKNKSNNNQMRNLIFATIVVVASIGFAFYIQRKNVQYGDNFDMTKFLFADRNVQ